MEVMFITSKVGLKVTFTNLTKISSGYTFEWDLGDGSEKVTLKNPTHKYSGPGFFDVTLRVVPIVENEGTEPLSLTQTIVVSDRVSTSLTGSIYQLIDNYVPVEIVGRLSFPTKQVYIEKWQLYLQPLVNHIVLPEEYNNELCYEALENQLIMELSVFDYLTVTLTNLVQSRSYQHISQEVTPGEETNQGVKKIVTGPTEVEFFDKNATDSDIMINAIKAVQPGGILDMLRKNLCTLSERLEIYLPFCSKVYDRVIPTMTNKGVDRPLRGPNPGYPVKKR